MRAKVILPCVLVLTISGPASATAEDRPKPAPVQAEPSKSASTEIAEVGKEGIVQPAADDDTTISAVANGEDSRANAEAHVAGSNFQADPAYFLTDVMPLIVRFGCNAAECHGSQKGKGGLKLSMFAADPEYDHTALTRSAKGRRINWVEPAKSLLLLKATASISHEGGKKFEVGSPEYDGLAAWIAQGAPLANEKAPKLVSIKVLPEKQALQKGKTGQLSATAVFSDGAEKDVTPDAFYQSSEESVAAVGGDGKVKADGYGQAAVVVTYMRRFATARIVVPQPLPSPFPEVEANNKIDELVVAKLKELGIPPSEACSDQEFLRRVYLDLIGTLPTADEVREFLSDADPR